MKKIHINNDDNYATPPEFYEELNKRFNFDFDPCPYSENEITVDGLKIEWGNSNFINPPYSQKLKEKFIKKGIEEMKKGKVCVFLLPVSTSTKLFQEYIKPNATKIEFIKGRIKFGKIDETGKFYLPLNSKGKTQSGTKDSMIVVFDGRVPAENIKDLVLSEYKNGNIVTATFDGIKAMSLKEFVKQPAGGMLYDLNRCESVVLTFINDPKWINDYAVAQVIRELKRQIDELKSNASCRFGVGDTVISINDAFSETEHNKDGAKNVGKETYTVNKVEYWKQGEGYLVYGEKSDKRNCQVWHHENDLKLIHKKIPNK